jgi:Kef-type K+ transport system membrane component KefB
MENIWFIAAAWVAMACAHYVIGWELRAAQITGIALSTTSVAVVYAVMVEGGLSLIVALLGVKITTKFVGVWPLTRVFGMSIRDGHYTTLLMSTGLPFGSMSALYGLTNGIID